MLQLEQRQAMQLTGKNSSKKVLTDLMDLTDLMEQQV